MRNLQIVRQVSGGLKQAQFPVLGRASGFSHGPGDNILDGANALLNTIKHAERVISIDDLLIAPVVIDRLEEMKNHYDLRRPYAMELGRALAEIYDRRSIVTALLTARAADTIDTSTDPDQPAKTASILDADFHTNGSSAVDTLFQAAEILDNQHVPQTDRYALVQPSVYYNLVKQTDLLNRDFGGANGVFSDGTVFKVAGIELVKSTHTPYGTVIADNTGIDVGARTPNAYFGTFTNTRCVVFHKSATGAVKLMDLAFESEYRMELQGHLMLAKLACGIGPLRPEAALEIVVA